MHYKSLILLLIITSCGVTKQSYIQPTSNINISASLADDEAVSSIIEPYKKGMSKAMDEVIGFCPAFLEKKKRLAIPTC